MEAGRVRFLGRRPTSIFDWRFSIDDWVTCLYSLGMAGRSNRSEGAGSLRPGWSRRQSQIVNRQSTGLGPKGQLRRSRRFEPHNGFSASYEVRTSVNRKSSIDNPPGWAEGPGHRTISLVPSRELGILTHIAAEAIGQPGQRRFRLLAMNDVGDTASLWLEKEQLIALAEAIENVLRDEGFEYQPRPLDDAPEPPVYPLNASIDFRIAQLSMGLDRDNRRIVLIAADGPEDDDTTTLNMSFEFTPAHELRQQIATVVAAGRPPCPLCTAPMDPAGHVCVRTNGHQPH
jgi:uncharacterized repeat protein (TIGR03847 family)